jgi:hypothetical protein
LTRRGAAALARPGDVDGRRSTVDRTVRSAGGRPV